MDAWLVVCGMCGKLNNALRSNCVITKDTKTIVKRKTTITTIKKCKHSYSTFGNTWVSFTEQHFYLPTILHFYTCTFLLHVRAYMCVSALFAHIMNVCWYVVCCTHANCDMSLATCILNGQQCRAITALWWRHRDERVAALANIAATSANAINQRRRASVCVQMFNNW